MSFRANHILVVLADDYDTEALEPILETLRRIRGVAHVEHGAADTSAAYVGAMQERARLTVAVVSALRDVTP